jgi:delta 1-pyrroline-5-carboxylate dehydrogenase
LATEIRLPVFEAPYAEDDAVIAREPLARTRLSAEREKRVGIEDTVDRVVSRLPVGNVYVNRDMIGAVVGVQPFDGHGLSGTGPKAGGPNYLPRFAAEQTVTVNTAAVGGNAALPALDEE